MKPHLRVARPTDRLDEIVAQYIQGLDLKVLGRFQDHDGYNGVMLGYGGLDYHLEFTSHVEDPVGPPPDDEHLLVFYYPEADEWEQVCNNMKAAGFKQLASRNPYWDVAGKTYMDLDGYRVVIQNAAGR